MFTAPSGAEQKGGAKMRVFAPPFCFVRAFKCVCPAVFARAGKPLLIVARGWPARRLFPLRRAFNAWLIFLPRGQRRPHGRAG